MEEVGLFTRIEKHAAHKRGITKRARAQPVAVEHLRKLQCRACPLRGKALYHPSMNPTGAEQADIYILGEAPGEHEDKCGEQFVGNSGKELRRALPKELHDNYRVRFNNCVRCRPMDGASNREPTPVELECCRPSVEEDIAASKPKAIIGTGNFPLRWVLGTSKGLQGVTIWRGRRFPVCVGGHSCWFYPVLHPSYVMRQKNIKGGRGEVPGSEILAVFERDLHKVFSDLDADDLYPPTVPSREEVLDGIEWATGKELGGRGLRHVLKELERYGRMTDGVAVDIETSKLRPYEEGAKLLTFGVGNDKEAFAFPIDHPGSRWSEEERRSILKAIRQFLRTPIPKVAQNTAFELEWFLYLFKDANLLRACTWHDTMQQAYSLDIRSGGHNLNFLCAQWFGVPLKAVCDLNVAKLDTYPVEDVLRYNGVDAKWEFKLFLAQRNPVICAGVQEVYEAQCRRLVPLVMAQYQGVDIDQDTIVGFQSIYDKRVTSIGKRIQKLPEVKQYVRKHGSFTPSSPKQVGTLLASMGVKEVVKGKLFRTGEEVLSKLQDVELAKLVLEFRSAQKAKSTYVDPLSKVVGSKVHPDGKVHTSYNTTYTATGRLSSDSPNLQNMPKRDSEKKKLREAFVPPRGHMILSVDYGQIEARLIAMDSKDPRMVHTLQEDYDIHMHWANKVAKVAPNLLGRPEYDGSMKRLRSAVKNKLVFPAFYGSWASSIAKGIGIPNKLVTSLFDEFWEEFAGVKKWQKRLLHIYAKEHRVVGLTGRVRYAPLSENMIYNTPIQGAASDIVMNAMCRLSEDALKEDKPWLQAVMNIHDDLVFFLPKGKVEEATEEIIISMVDVPFDFVNVPISVEATIGGNWYDMSEVGTFRSDEVLVA